MVQLMLSRGAMLSQPNEKGYTPLLCAVKAGYWDIAVILLREGADIECTDSHGRSTLMIAAAEGHVGLVEMLLTNSKYVMGLLPVCAAADPMPLGSLLMVRLAVAPAQLFVYLKIIRIIDSKEKWLPVVG